MKTLVLDTETDNLVGYTKFHVLACIDFETGEKKVFRKLEESYIERAKAEIFLNGYDRLVGHNILGFDMDVLKHFGIAIKESMEVIDTYVLSTLFNYRLKGGHSLENWGEFFRSPKSLYDDFSVWSQELEDRCLQDALLTNTLYKYLRKYWESPSWSSSIALEHATVNICRELHKNGFKYSIDTARKLEKELEEKVNGLLQDLQKVFLPKPKFIRVITPVATKAGGLHSKDFRWLPSKDLSPYTAGEPFSLIEFEEFNPRSQVQRIDVLWEAGWKPINKTKGHIKAERDGAADSVMERYAKYGWVTDEDNLATLPEDAPEAARKLAEFLLLSSRLEDLQEWNGLYNASTGRIHGTFQFIGSWTHRKSHQKPNMANIPSLEKNGRVQPYGKEMRSLWTVEPGRILVGCDAEGIQLRLFAHYCNDRKLIEAIVSGKKEDGTDIHSLNKSILDTICNSRGTAKTYIYALLLGAGTAKQASILGCSQAQAKEGLSRILEFYPGWKELKEGRLKEDASRGYFIGLDGRAVMFPSAHHILAGYLQNGETVVMKKACLKWHDTLKAEGIDFLFVDDVHDEWQTDTLEQFGDFVGETQANSIRIVGEELGLNCPLAGKYVKGINWAETH